MSDERTVTPAPAISGVSEARALPVNAPASPPGGARSAVEDRWLAREPWRDTALNVLVTFGSNVGIYWTLGALMGMEVTPTRVVSFAAFMSVWHVVTRRNGVGTPAAPLLILGGATLGAGALVVGTEVVQGRPIEWGVPAIFAFLGSGMLLWGLVARRRARELDEGLSAERVAPVLIPRAELARRMEAIQSATHAESKRFLKWLGLGVLGFAGLFGAGAATGAGKAIPEWGWALAFFGFWGALGGMMAWANKRLRSDSQQYGLICSACDRPFGSTLGNMRLMKNITEIGRCPQCGVRIVSEDAP